MPASPFPVAVKQVASENSRSFYLVPPKLQPKLHIDISSRFGLRLRELRHERNLTQLRMAIDFGIDRSYISDVERGCKAISLPMLEVIALGFNVSLAELFRDL